MSVFIYNVRKGVKKIERLSLEGKEGEGHMRNERGVRILPLEGGKGKELVRNKREGNQEVVTVGFLGFLV